MARPYALRRSRSRSGLYAALLCARGLARPAVYERWGEYLRRLSERHARLDDRDRVPAQPRSS